ncbi:hypothetical protein SAMN05660831_01843 [Thiohalospira halophila DSM 15071]|uniref:Uncharacterized protein n=1 Tax=Thiohalospira halophila DSM 15071 TaxID=1123397 RepID=A0A1I1TF11_9GAMM|nr:hypothetical protein [Thiohalospira halophila]SFD55728.1 hypothetical protein SAMN05660831_01843 [Thiohalospira halophila DSM 15071]
MGYKRRARLLFLGQSAEVAADLARERAPEWVKPVGEPPFDLVIRLGEADDPAPEGVRCLHWPETDRDGLIRRIDGLAGGMRLLARSEGTTAPGE